jgi:tRNA(Ile)-lysidine synthase
MKTDLERRIEHNLKKKGYPSKSQACLLAFSGGVDSTVLATIMHRLGYKIAIAHVNYHLRGKDSDRDELFSKNWADEKGIPFHLKSVDGAQLNQIQSEARNIRYAWFDELCKIHNYTYIATAHHQSDRVETILLNFIRGTGLDGLRGIPEKRGKIIRPLILTPKEEILDYAEANGLHWCADASNEESNYTRNWLRNDLIPFIEQRFPSMQAAIGKRAEDFREIKTLFQIGLEKELSRLVYHGKFGPEMRKHALLNHPAGATLLYEWLNEAGFNREMVKEVFENLQATTGKCFSSNSHVVYIQRSSIALISKAGIENETIVIDGPGVFRHSSGDLKIRKLPANKHSEKSSAKILDLSEEDIQSPLILRTWKAGDYFYPEGFTKENGKAAKKKVSDFLTDLKLEPVEKINQPVLVMGNQILWIPGFRKDSRTNTSKKTKTFLRLTWKSR